MVVLLKRPRDQAIIARHESGVLNIVVIPANEGAIVELCDGSTE
jgi:hypothetical protein